MYINIPICHIHRELTSSSFEVSWRYIPPPRYDNSNHPARIIAGLKGEKKNCALVVSKMVIRPMNGYSVTDNRVVIYLSTHVECRRFPAGIPGYYS